MVSKVAEWVSSWGYARLFAECIDKIHFDPAWTKCSADEQAFEQLVSRFEQYLSSLGDQSGNRYGVLVHDNNETVAKKHADLMRRFHSQGTLWTKLHRLIETPLFFDSSLTRMAQVADLCGYALRRYLENQEADLFNSVFEKADRRGTTVVGVRHYTNANCICEICRSHRPKPQSPLQT